jgi:predicted DNA-binding ribbon-helix-helix protein
MGYSAFVVLFPHGPAEPPLSRKLGSDNSGCWSQFRFDPTAMKSLITGHSIVIAGRKTKVSLEGAFWNCLRQIAKERNESFGGLVTKINADRQLPNLSSAIRVFVLDYYRNLALRAQPKEAAPTLGAGRAQRSAPNPGPIEIGGDEGREG